MQLGDLASLLADDEQEVDGICPGYVGGTRLDGVDRVGLIPVFGASFQNRFETGCVLQLLVRMGVLLGLERRDGVICTELCTHFGKDCGGDC